MSSSGELEAAFRALVTDLPAACSWAVVGGIAVSARAEPRFTRDVDLAVAVSSDDEAEALIASLLRRRWSRLQWSNSKRSTALRRYDSGPRRPAVSSATRCSPAQVPKQR